MTLEVSPLDMIKVPWHMSVKTQLRCLILQEVLPDSKGWLPSIFLPYATGSVLGLSVPIPGPPLIPLGSQEGARLWRTGRVTAQSPSVILPQGRKLWMLSWTQNILRNPGWEEEEGNKGALLQRQQ